MPPKIASLRDYSKDTDRDADDDNKDQELYAGGVDNRGGGSGLSVIDPVDRMIAAAQRSNDSALGEGKKKLTMYKNGVMLQGGSFHSLDDPNTKAILDAISQGQVHPALFSPEEAEQARSKPLEIVLEDQRTQDYIAPFSSSAWNGGAEGNTLGKKELTASSVFSLENIPTDALIPCDDSKPSTTIQVKLANGKKLKIKLNHSSSVKEILKIIKQEGAAENPFTISTGFPPVELTDSDMTVSEAKLIAASITQQYI